MTWDPSLYLRYGDERTRAARDLLARVPHDRPGRVIDLGCGPGNSTALLRARWPEAEILGIDNDPAMLARATADVPSCSFAHGDLTCWHEDGRWDIVYSNAAIQWVPDHEELLPRIWAAVRPGGALAVQVPAHTASPVHRAMVEVSQEPQWSERLASARTAIRVEAAGVYYDLIAPTARSIDLWYSEYHHVLASPSAIVEFISSTGMRPFLAPLDAGEREQFRSAVLARAEQAYPRQSDGKVLFPFRRLFLVAVR